ncbi:MAG: glycerophosphodiester phosphodiesterase [Spirochaetia bacterium]
MKIRKFQGFEKGPLLFGHRGYSAKAPENTLPAFELLLEHSIPAVELDVQMCATGELVVFHDFTLDRVTTGTGRIADTPWEKLSKLDAGKWFDPRFTGTKIPKLLEVFTLLGDSVYYDIELKEADIGKRRFAGKVLALIQDFGLEHHCMVSSFNPFTMRRFTALRSALPSSYIFPSPPAVPPFFRNLWGRRFSRSIDVLKPNFAAITEKILKGPGKQAPILTWTVDDPNLATELLQKGIQGIISNDPLKIQPAFSQ